MDSEKTLAGAQDNQISDTLAPAGAYQITSYNDLTALPPSANALLEQSTLSFFLNKQWFQSYCQHIETPNIQLICLTEPNGQVIALLPLQLQRIKQYGVNLNVLSSLGNYYSVHFDLIYDKRAITRVSGLSAIFALLKQQRHWDIIDLTPLTPEQLSDVNQASVEAEISCFDYWKTSNFYHPDLTTYQDYMDKRSSRVKNTLKRKAKKLTKAHSWNIALFTNVNELDTAMADYHHVYANSWKISEASPEFINQMNTVAAEQSKLRLGILYANDKPVAAQTWIVHQGVASIYKLSYDEAFKDYSPGTILSDYLNQHVIEQDGVHTIDFLTGSDRYKADWMSHRQELHGVQLTNKRTLKGLWITLITRAARIYKQLRSPKK